MTCVFSNIHSNTVACIGICFVILSIAYVVDSVPCYSINYV